MKKYLISSLIFSIILISLGIWMITAMIKNRVEANIDLLLKQAVYRTNKIQNYIDTFPEEAEYYVHRHEYLSILDSEEVDSAIYWDIKRFYNKYKHIIEEIQVQDNKYFRSIKSNDKQVYSISARMNINQPLNQSKQRIELDGRLIMIYPVFDASDRLVANIKFVLNINAFIQSELAQESLDKSSWIFLVDQNGIKYTYTLSPRYDEEEQISLERLPDAKGIALLPFITSSGTIVQSGQHKLNLIYAYNSLKILKSNYGLIYAKEKSSVILGIRFVAIVLSILFALILTITILTFRHLLKTIRKEEINMARIKMAVDNANDLVLITTTNYQPIFANQAFYAMCDDNTSKSEKPIERLISEQAKLDEIKESLLGTNYWSGELELRFRQGSAIPCLMRSNVIREKSGEILGYLFIATDITERKRSERMKNEFISTVSHELRTPLTSIRGSLGLIKGGVSGDISPHAKKLIDIAYTNSERLIRLINDILDIEKIEAGAMEFHLQKTELLPELVRSIKMMTNYATQYNVNIHLKKPLAGVEAIIDPDRFEQVMNNLLSNACKFSPSGAKIEVEMLAKDDKTIRISVRDHGTGIPEEFRKSMFGKFAQVDSSDTRSKGGTGLGLSITKAIVEKFGGAISYESELNVGTVFHVDLPVYITPQSSFEPSSISTAPRILIVEDDVDIATLIHIVLKNAGYEADIAYSAEDAKQKMQLTDYSLVSLDLLLPKQQGISFIQELRADEKYASLPIVVVSAVADKKQNELHGGFGIVDWISKPIDMERLQRAVTESLIKHDPDNKRILYIEDDEDNILILEQLLKDKAELVSAKTIAEAKHMINNETFKLILLDLSLPDGSGLEIIPYLKQAGKQSIPVLIFSAFDVPPDLNQDIFGALVKSKTSNEDLVSTIQSIIDDHK